MSSLKLHVCSPCGAIPYIFVFRKCRSGNYNTVINHCDYRHEDLDQHQRCEWAVSDASRITLDKVGDSYDRLIE